MTTQLWYVADVPLPTSKEQRTHIPRYKNRQTNASHHGNQSGSSGPEVPFARSPERRCPTSSRPTSVHATNTSIRNGNFKSSPQTHTHIPRYKNRQTNASHHGNQSGSSGPEVPFARSPERRCPTSSRPTSVHATNTSIRNGNFKSSPL